MTPFNPHQGLILVAGTMHGPSGQGTLRLALDTGATQSLVSARLLTAVGYDLTQATSHAQLATANGVIRVPLLTLTRLSALGQDRPGFLVAAHNLPAAATIDGLLGLDFIRGQTLKIDFRTGLIDLQ